jgi:hypothetical protein
MMSSRWDTILAWTLGILLMGLLGGGPYILRHLMRGITKSELDARISRDLPVGSTKAKVLAYIGSRKWELRSEKNPIVARFRDRPPLSPNVFTVQFTFDADGNLIAYSSTETYEGP